MLQRIGLILVSIGFALLLGVIAVLTTLGARPGLVGPVLAAGLGAAAAVLGGARLLERERDPNGF